MQLYDTISVPICNHFVKGIFAKTDDAAQFLRNKGLKKVKCVGVGLDIDKFQKIQPISEYTYTKYFLIRG